MYEFNQTKHNELDKRFDLIQRIFGKPTGVWIEPSFYFCYGNHISIGEWTYINFNCNFVGDGQIVIGKRVMFGPAVTNATVNHPIHPGIRRYMYAKDVVIEDNCWIGANVVITPGVTIGENSIIGTGSVVTKDIPKNSIAVGNPAKVIREINEHDLKFYDRTKPITENDLIMLKKLGKKK